jgi:hypothetical protein
MSIRRAEKIKPKRAVYVIAGQDVCGIEFDARFNGEEEFSRLFYVVSTDSLYRWMLDRTPQMFEKIKTSSISQRRKESLLKAWNETRGVPKITPKATIAEVEERETIGV